MSILRALPIGWRRVSLESVAHIQTGIAKGKRGLVEPVTLPYLRVANVQDGFIDLSKLKSIEVDRISIDRYRLKEGDVLLTEGGDYDKLGRGCVWRNQVGTCLHQNHVFAVRPRQSILLPDFLSYQAASSYGKHYFLNCSKQSTNLASINSTQVKQFPLLLPTLVEQKAIIRVVALWDHAITLTERLIAAKQQLRRGLMQQLLTGKRRFPGFSEPWREVRLGQVTVESTERNSGALGREAVRAVTNSVGMVPMQARLIADSIDRYKIVQPNGFAYNPMRINVGSLCIWTGTEPALVSPDYVVFACDPEQLDPRYFNILRETHRWDYYMQAAGNGSVRVRIWYDDLAALHFELPPLVEQRSIATFFGTLDSELTLLHAQLTALQTQKRGLMQQLLTGKVRVPLPDTETVADTEEAGQPPDAGTSEAAA